MRIFWRIFLSVWLAMVILLAIVFSTGGPWEPQHWNHREAASESSALDLRSAIRLYEQGGTTAFQNEIAKTPGMQGNVILFGADFRVLAPGERTATPWIPMAAAAFRSNAPEIRRVGARVGCAIPIQSASGQQYVAAVLAISPLRPRWHRPQFWTKLALAIIPATVICFGLALYVTRPLLHLGLTARRLAAGELTARPDDAQKQRKDEFGALSRDIDGMASRIEELLSAQSRFVNSVSHELGAPLTRMQLAITLLQRELPSHAPEALQRIEYEADKLSILVQELLYLASLEKGLAPTETFLPVSLDAICLEIVRDNVAETEERQCTVSLSLEPITVHAASQALRRAIENVFRNAIRHTPRGSSIQLSCRADNQPGYAVVEVSDSGPGVTTQMLSSMFQPFVRAPARQTEVPGTGLGLAIAAEAIALHGGKIWAQILLPEVCSSRFAYPSPNSTGTDDAVR